MNYGNICITLNNIKHLSYFHSHHFQWQHLYKRNKDRYQKCPVQKSKKRQVCSDRHLGYFKMEEFQGGQIEFEISAPGYKTITVIIQIKQGKHITIDYELEPKA